MGADWIIFGGTIETMEPAGRTAEAVAIADGRILDVGSRETIDRLASETTRKTDLEGASLLPAFTDTHMHLEKIASELMMVHLEEAKSLDQLLAATADVASRSPAGEWVQAFGDDNAWHERQLDEARLPTRAELDEITTEHPVFLLRGPDVAALNSLAVTELESEIASLDDVELDGAAGLLRGSDIRLLQGELRQPTRQRQLELLELACRELLSFGITAVVDPGLPARFADSWALYTEAREQDRLLVRVELMDRFDYRLSFETEFERRRAEPVVPNTGDDYLRAFGVKLILDGEFSNAWLRPGEAAGVVPEQRYTVNEFDAVLDLCAQRGWPFCTHVMGGGAVDFVVDRVEAAIRAGAHFAPYQLSLAHVFLPSRQNLSDCARLGIALSVQPLLAYVFEQEMVDAWGKFAQQSNPYATMRESGLRPAGGSDVLPCEPLRGAQVAVTRRSRDGTVLAPSEALSARAAIELFTSAAGPYMRRFDRGRIVPGYVADVVAWSENPLATAPDNWLTLEPRFVAIDGEVVHDA